MKKIINGKKYNTETATALGDMQHSYPGQFEYYSETLYRKKTGEFFLYGEGGAMTKYREPYITGGWTGGEKIFPITDAEAREWVEENLDADAYEEIFGEVEE